MKIKNQDSSVNISGAQSSPSRFNIKASGVAFKILSSGLYTNKVRAIIRELSCNAHDAHIAAGKRDVPFELHLPTVFEPFFTVIDKGTGLAYCPRGCVACKGGTSLDSSCNICDGTGDYDQVTDIYTTYFESTKNNSNEYTGALGLGSKSPFCYTEIFSVTNTFNGEVRVYSCFLDAEGLPTTVLQTTTYAPERHNGLEVSFPVKQNDVWEFKNQAAKALELFDPAPIVNIELKINKAQYVSRGDEFGIRTMDCGLGKDVRAVQGPVAYKIGNIDISKLNENQQEILLMPLDLFFDIGDLSVAASRESLSNDTQTIANLLKVISRVREHLLIDVKKRLSSAKSYWEARVMLYSLSNSDEIGRIVGAARDSGDLDGSYKNFTFKNENPSINQLDYPDIVVSEFVRRYRGEDCNAHKNLLSYDLPSEEQTQLLAPEQIAKNYRIEFETKYSGVFFVINDIGFGAEKYVHQLVQRDKTYDQKLAYLITRENRKVPKEKIVSDGMKIIAQLGNPSFILASELRERYKAVYEKKETVKRDLLVFQENSHYRADRAGWRDAWLNGKDDPPELDSLKYYVVLKRLMPTTGAFYNAHDFSNFVKSTKMCGEFDLGDEKIYGVPEKYAKDLDDSWIELVGFVIGELKTVMTPKKEHMISLELNPISLEERIVEYIGKHKSLSADSPMQIFCNEYLSAKTYDKTKTKHLIRIISKTEYLGQYSIHNSIDFEKLCKSLRIMYPLLERIGYYDFMNIKETKQGVLDYINMIDERNRSKAASTDPGQTFAINPEVFVNEERTSHEEAIN